MKHVGFHLIFAAALIAGASALAQTSSWTPPAESARCPSKWGAGDERGAANHMKPESVLNALKIVRTGETIELGRVLNESMPISPGRGYKIITKRTAISGSNRLGANEEVVEAEIGQVGTQFDGFAHITQDSSLYNCFKLDDIATRTGFTKLGVHNVGTLIARGILIDVAGYKGVEMLGDTYEISVADLEDALSRQNLTLRPGDAILIHTGWGKLWGSDNIRYARTNPGIGISAAQWLIARDPILLGADNRAVEMLPGADPRTYVPVHQLAITTNGIHLLENMKLDELAAKRIYEFAFIVQPLKIEGGTGSTVAPVAVR
jgi:kynurenine formamidase